MPGNGATSRKSTSHQSVLDLADMRVAPGASTRSTNNDNDGMLNLGSMFDDIGDGLQLKLKKEVREKLPVVKRPGDWNSEVTYREYWRPAMGIALTCEAGDDIKQAVDRNAGRVRKIPASLAKAFPTGRPLEDQPNILKCNHCKRPVLDTAMPKHIESCLNKRQEKQRKKKEAKEARDAAARKEKGQDSDEEDIMDSKTTKTGAGKKRKATDEGDDGIKKKKKKDDPKAKGGKPKAPVDVEKQCGVELPQGGQCARSLTCKSHSMGAKRAVPGRSAPYDKLLMEYQRKNQAKLQKAAMDANAPDPDDDSLPTGPIDEDEEKETVVASLARAWGGQPLYSQPLIPLRRKYEYNRMKGMLATALGGRTGLFGGVFSGGSLFGGSREADPARSNLPQARPMGAPLASRKPSVASAIAV